MDKLIGGIFVGILGAVVASVLGGVVLLLMFIGTLITGSIVFYLWSWAGPLYFDFLPAKYIHIPWFHTVLLTWLFGIIGSVLFKSTSSSDK